MIQDSRDNSRGPRSRTTMASKYCHGLFTVNIALLILFSSNSVKASEDVTVIPTKTWRFLDGSEVEVPQKFRENIDEFSVGQTKCLRWVLRRVFLS